MVKVVNGIVAVVALAVLCTACGERERREAKEMAAPAAGCCQKADNTCASPVTLEQCTELNGTFTEGAACGDDGTCGAEQPQ
ncbi:hypothetical protein SAMN04487965_2067 [Microbulbifer donghaiensis]|uniref:Uncharacterized protein n=1 Tax=Microbulbifer donghaiensis TaxID=494016 RepID=A0A1M5B4F7_9GAMM|nr:hypothetical protein [Microbulbifer donghaiensis]SHF37335.1 hypothetical protein SAMN04487965_2067 [Microbulbifer donghaiensis]